MTDEVRSASKCQQQLIAVDCCGFWYAGRWQCSAAVVKCFLSDFVLLNVIYVLLLLDVCSFVCVKCCSCCFTVVECCPFCFAVVKCLPFLCC